MRRSVLVFLFVLMLSVAGAAGAESSGDGGKRPPRRRPPPEAITACSKSKEGDACSFQAPHGQVEGKCKDCQGVLACVPPHPPREEGAGQEDRSEERRGGEGPNQRQSR